MREKLSGYYAPAYGPRAFGLNARSNTLTDWPGGSFVGIHGTNAPQILPEARLARLCAYAERGDPQALPADVAAGHAGQHSLAQN